MNDKCVGCGENEIKYIKRGLCQSCYASAYSNNELHFYPIDLKRWATRKYSAALLEDFENLVANDGITLEDVGKKHGFTRENVRQLFLRIYGFHYTVIKQTRVAKRHERLKEQQLLERDPRSKIVRYIPSGNLYAGAQGENKVLEICIALGYEVKPYLPGQQIDLVINGFKVDVKSAYTTTLTGKGVTRQFHFSVSEYQRVNCDFIICYAEPINKYFIIPIIDYPQSEHLYIPEKPSNAWVCRGVNHASKSKWYDYLEAWHLLKPEPKEMVFNSSLADSSANSDITPAVQTLVKDRGDAVQAVQ